MASAENQLNSAGMFLLDDWTLTLVVADPTVPLVFEVATVGVPAPSSASVGFDDGAVPVPVGPVATVAPVVASAVGVPVSSSFVVVCAEFSR